MNFVSISKRTDIPAFYAEWLHNRFVAGYAKYFNPFNPEQIIEVSLRPNDVAGYVFWSRNYNPFIKFCLHDFKKLPCLFYITINNYPRHIDRSTPRFESIISSLDFINNAFPFGSILWRYDPVVVDESLDVNWHLSNFRMLCSVMSRYTNRCYTSYVDFYKKTQRAFRIENLDIHKSLPLDLFENMSYIASEYNIEMFACNEPLICQLPQYSRASCIDAQLFYSLYGSTIAKSKFDKCGCFASKDIGAYDTCLYRCIYCYANQDFELKSKNNLIDHDPNSEFIVEPKSKNSSETLF